MTAAERLSEWGYEDVVIFENPSFDNALVGVSEDNRAVYDYDKMVVWLAVTWAISREEAIEFIEYNTIRALPYTEAAPIVMYRIPK
jgi:hypothetical protein